MVIRGALARVMGHGEHSLSPDRAMNGNRDGMKTHRKAQTHVLRPVHGLAQVGKSTRHGIAYDSENAKGYHRWPIPRVTWDNGHLTFDVESVIRYLSYFGPA